MKALFHGADFEMPTGYANQIKIWMSYLAAHGWEVALSCLAGPTSARAARKTLPVLGQDGTPVLLYPCTPYEQNGQDVVAGHYADFGADLIFTLTCSWVLNPMAWRDMRTIMITPVDVEGMSGRDYEVIAESGAMPAAVCRWGETQMQARKLHPLYLPHGIDTQAFRPPGDRKATRRAKGLDHRFVVGVNAANHERDRKNFSEVFGAFALFLHGDDALGIRPHPNALLALHTIAILPEGLHLPALAAEWGIADSILWSDQYQLATGTVGWEALADWYGTLDVLVSAGNEGFGLPRVEAMACGTPVIAGDWGPSAELLAGAGWLVSGQRKWNNWHRRFWYTPHIAELAAALADAYRDAGERRAAARAAALAWDAGRVWEEHWLPVVKDLE